MSIDLTTLFSLLIVSAVPVLFFIGNAWAIHEKATLEMELPPPDIPQPQLFCGYCHVLTYPGVVQKGYELWKKGKHNKVGCVECHYPPRGAEVKNTTMPTDTEAKPSHIPAKPPGHFSYLPLGGDTIRTRPHVADASCMTAACHGKPDDKFKTKKIQFTEKVIFIHEPHLDKKKQIEGQQVNCTSCHQHETDQKKFEVSQESCVLCHFTNVKFNEDRGRCELCHELPKKPIQTSGEKPITHQILKDAKVSCGGCHYELIRATGRTKYEAYFEKGVLKTALVIGAGDIKKGNCIACHDQTKALKEVGNKKLMHEKHVTVKNARCFDCHQVIMHKKSDINQPMVAEADDKKTQVHKPMDERFVTDSCLACHPKPHELQRLLRAGLKRKGVPETPDFHLTVRTNCMACHKEREITEKGERILKASAKACVGCHKGRDNLLEDWKTDLEDMIKETVEIEKEALEALAEVQSKLPPAKLDEARKMLKEGRESRNMVQYGNGVHNKKYSMFLLDAAMTRFEEVLDLIEEAE